MWSRPDLKARAKYAFKKNYWTAVAVAFILMLIGAGYTTSDNTYNLRTEYNSESAISDEISDLPDGVGNTVEHAYGYGLQRMFGGIIGTGLSLALTGMLLVFALAGVLINIFFVNPMTVGGARFFMENRAHNPAFSVLFKAFRGNYGNVVLTMFLKNLFTFLWTLLFIIPGVIKSYEYRMIPYILSENPGMDYHRAFEISKQMMNGQKLEAFVLDLSFIGWMIVSAFTCNLAGIFYVAPYVEATNAELYAVLREHAFHTGYLTINDLPGYGPVYQ